MGKIIRVTPEELGKASQKLQTISETYTQIYTELLQQAGTMGAAWEADDNLAFVEQINGFCEELKMMATKLSTAAQTLEKQKTNYETRRENNIAQVKKLAN